MYLVILRSRNFSVKRLQKYTKNVALFRNWKTQSRYKTYCVMQILEVTRIYLASIFVPLRKFFNDRKVIKIQTKLTKNYRKVTKERRDFRRTYFNWTNQHRSVDIRKSALFVH